MPLSDLLGDLFADFRNPAILWQALAIVACVAVGWGLARLIHGSLLKDRGQQGGLISVGLGSFGRVLGPLLIVGLLALAKVVMAQYYSVHLLRVALPLFMSLAVIRTFFYLLRRAFARRGQLGAALQTFERVFAFVAWVIVALHLTGVLPDVIRALERTVLPIGKNKVSIADLLQGAISIVVLMMLALWAGAALEERLMGFQRMHTSLRVAMARVGRAALILVALLFSLSLAGLDLTVLSVFGGALGVGLGLGMQRIASNYVSGFIILFERSLTIGDPITLDKYSGKVSHINTRYTVLRSADGTQTLLPNEMLITGVVMNQSGTNRNVRAVTKLVVSYDSDLSVVMPLLEQLPKDVPRVLEAPAPNVLLNAFAADGYELEVGFWLGDPENGQGGPISEVNRKIYALVQAGTIKLGHPAMDTRLLDAHITSVVARTPHTPDQTGADLRA
ncbi:mechanosensitive ion channel family protein [Massilia sp. YIM B02443]|uniref:mechanosensitive ion channel family protein n=1 Tax=Massilia sp. YIM B02443 TaxID=3050127 RepID=UPI0025B6E6AA|nr:mechanosensitive ion channel domain-containing protein [Massilia sp. YIM B02443]MDN4035661.1 mechanosensitive ion channel [Massilia sp. YIM B02443]